jgi:hypothetical protein
VPKFALYAKAGLQRRFLEDRLAAVRKTSTRVRAAKPCLKRASLVSGERSEDLRIVAQGMQAEPFLWDALMIPE